MVDQKEPITGRWITYGLLYAILNVAALANSQALNVKTLGVVLLFASVFGYLTALTRPWQERINAWVNRKFKRKTES